MKIIGLDLSLTGTGVAVVGGDDWPRVLSVSTIRSTGTKDATLRERRLRLDRIEREVLTIVEGVKPGLVVIEQPAYGATTGHHHDRSGLWWRIVSVIDDLYADVAEVTPTTLKKYITGRGNAGKDEVLLAVARRFPGADVNNNNEADSLVLAAMGADHLGKPISPMPAAHRGALDAVRWPCPS